MKKRILTALAAILLLSLFSLPALAAEDSAAPAGAVGGSSSAAPAEDYTISVFVTPGGTATTSAIPLTASAGTDITFTVTPTKGYAVQTVTVTGNDGRSVEVKSLGNSRYSFVMPACPVRVLAVLEKPAFNVTANSTGGGSVGIDPTPAREGETVTVTVMPKANRTVQSVTATGENGSSIEVKSLGNSQYTFVMPACPVKVLATMVSTEVVKPTYRVSTVLDGSGNVHVSPSTAAEGETVTVSVVPDANFTVKSFQVTTQAGKVIDSKVIDGTQYSFVMPDSPVTASVVLVNQAAQAPTYSVTSVITGGGSIAVDPAPAAAKQTVTVTVRPDPGYSVKTFTVLGKNGEALPSTSLGNNRYSFVMPDAPVIVNAELVDPAKATVTNPIHLSITGSGKAFVTPSTASAGQNVILSATPGSKDLSTTVTATDKNGKTVPVAALNDGQYSFVMPDSETSLVVSFVKTESTFNVQLVTEGKGQSIASPTSAREGQTINVRTLPQAGYTVQSVVAVDATGTRLEVRDLGNGQYNFAMPGSPVTVTVTYVPAGTGSETGTDTKDGCKKDLNCPIAAFTDANPTAWYHDGVHFCLEKGLMNGISSNRFDPNGTTTRAMIVTILWRQAGKPASNGIMTFYDVPDGKWYTEAIRWAQVNKIVTGYSSVEFGPNDSITREQLAAILYRYAQSQGVKGSFAYLPFSDAASIHDWAFDGVCWCYSGKVVNGKGNNLFAPRDLATRAEAATMIQRFCEVKL